MLRSFQYAAEVGRREHRDDEDLSAFAAAWERFNRDQFLEGYLAVQLSAFEARYGQHPFGPVFTGPSLITKANAARVQQLYKSTGIPLFNGGYPT